MSRVHISIELGDWNRQQARAAARLLRDRVLRELTGHDDPARLIQRTAMGKPFLPDHPEISWSCSSCGGATGIAWGLSRALGFDIEGLNPELIDDDLVRRCLTPNEQSVHSAAIRADPSRFFEIWTRKEAALKCIGTGLHLLPDAVEVGLSARQSPEAWSPVAAANHPACFVRSLIPTGNIHLAVASDQPAEIVMSVHHRAAPSPPLAESCRD